MCVIVGNGVGEVQSGLVPCENDLLPVSSLSNRMLFSDVQKNEWEVLRGV